MTAMVRLRWFLACLVLLALPLQGALAASMRLCLPAGQPTAVSVGPGHAADPAGGHHHHAAADAASMGHAPGGSGDTGDVQAGLPAMPDGADLQHTCDLCAACGHAAALPAGTTPVAASTGVVAHPALAPARIDTRGLPVPDKPPRA